MRFWVAAVALALAGCVTQPPVKMSGHALGLTPVGYSALPGWSADRADAALATFVGGCGAMANSPQQSLGGTGLAASLGGSTQSWVAACEAARRMPAGDAGAARAFFERAFQPYAVADTASDGKGLFTGYYEPELSGSRVAAPGFATPLLRAPPELVTVDLTPFDEDLRGRHITGRIQGGTFIPYYDRAAIDAGALEHRRLELLWVSDPVDAFILQIQGSGRVRLPDGSVVRVSYDGQNGRPYVPIGRVLAQRGDIPLDRVTMPAIRDWLAAHPDRAASLMETDPSYVFFHELGGVRADQGPPGALGSPLVPGRSIAVDKRFLPLGAPVFLDTTDPLDGSTFRQLMVAEDLGGAIRGPVRADVFWGWDADAATRAGTMKAPGRAWLLLPRSATVGSATVGSATVGSATVGSATVGSATVGSATVAEN